VFGHEVIPGWHPWVVMILPAGAFLTLGFLVAAMNIIEERTK